MMDAAWAWIGGHRLGINSLSRLPESRYHVLFIGDLALGGAGGTRLDLASAFDRQAVSKISRGSQPCPGTITAHLFWCRHPSILGPCKCPYRRIIPSCYQCHPGRDTSIVLFFHWVQPWGCHFCGASCSAGREASICFARVIEPFVHHGPACLHLAQPGGHLFSAADWASPDIKQTRRHWTRQASGPF